MLPARGDIVLYAPFAPCSTLWAKNLLAQLNSAGQELSNGISHLMIELMCRDTPHLVFGPATTYRTCKSADLFFYKIELNHVVCCMNLNEMKMIITLLVCTGTTREKFVGFISLVQICTSSKELGNHRRFM